jgi:ABC-type branched-subunit amino acid transport system substrate-binding protein
MVRRRNVLQGLVSATAVGSLSGCIGALGDEGPPVKFGVMLPLSGNLETVGTHLKRAAEQAASNVNDAGGIHGRPVEITAVDTEVDPETATERYQSLVEEGVVGIVGGLTSGVSAALAPLTAEDNIMQVSPSATSPQLSDAGRSEGRKYFGRTAPNDSLQALAMAKILDAPQYVDASSVSILAIDNAFGDGLAQALSDNLDATVVANSRYDPSADAFDELLSDLLEDDPDGVGFVSVAGQEGDVLDAYAETDADVPWVFSAGLFDGDTPPTYEGFYSASLSSSQTDGYLKLTRKLSDIAPLVSFTANSYDAMFLMATAAEKADEVSGTGIAGTIRSVSRGAGHTVSLGEFDRVRSLVDAGRELNYQGASGAVDLTENLEPLSQYLIQQVRDGRPQSLELLQRQFFQSGGNR